MADRYLLESAIPPVFPDGFTLEDGSGVLILESLTAEPGTARRYYQNFVAGIGGMPGV